MGAVRYSDKKRVVDFVPKGDGNNQGELIINWDRKLKNKGNAVNAI